VIRLAAGFSKVIAVLVLLSSGAVVAIVFTLLFFAFEGSDWN
jgi:uncharacterized phage infection (PIP) family protein YhgE